MKTLKLLFLSMLFAILSWGCSDDFKDISSLGVSPDKYLMFMPYKNTLPADSTELIVDVYLWVSDTTFLSVKEWEDMMDWQIERVSVRESGKTTNEISITTPTDTVRGDWFTLIRENNGRQLRCIVSPNDGEERTVWVGTTGVHEAQDVTCEFTQEGKVQ